MAPRKTTEKQDASKAHASLANRKDRAWLLVYHRDGAKVAVLSPNATVVIGREHPADVVLLEQSLSRRHAAFGWDGQGLWVEDLGSTNGTMLNGAKIQKRQRVAPGDEVALGEVSVTVQRAGLSQQALRGIESHDRLLARVEEEILRARTFGRPCSLLMVRAEGGDETHVSHWAQRVQHHLKPVDSVGLYGPDTLLVALPERAREETVAIADKILSSAEAPTLRCGLATFPEHGGGVEELLSKASEALRSATARVPVQAAPSAAREARESPLFAGAKMRDLLETAKRVSRSQVPVLILGETGAGKEIIATAIHAHSGRRAGPLKTLNCAAIPATLVETALFGHERGAFTGAEKRAKGIFEQADGGTVLLDEIGELSAAAQAALLRVLETKRVTRVGSDAEIEVDVRVIAATHRDLEKMADAGAFRSDLLYRLNTLTLRVPPLRDRVDEIPALAQRFLERAIEQHGASVAGFTPEATRLLCTYQWPGNVRELRNVVERAAVIAQSDRIGPMELPEKVRSAGGAADPEPTLESGRSAPQVEPGSEAERMVQALEQHGGNQTAAARSIQMPLRTFVRKLSTYGIRKRYDRG